MAFLAGAGFFSLLFINCPGVLCSLKIVKEHIIFLCACLVDLSLIGIILHQEFVPVSETVMIPFEYHRYIIGKNGGEVRSLMTEYSVNIAIPPPKDESEVVVVTGPPQRVAEAMEGLAKKVKDIKLDMEDKVSSVVCCILHFSASL